MTTLGRLAARLLTQAALVSILITGLVWLKCLQPSVDAFFLALAGCFFTYGPVSAAIAFLLVIFMRRRSSVTFESPLIQFIAVLAANSVLLAIVFALHSSTKVPCIS